MRIASISAIKESLREYIDAVRRGEEVIITNRGRPVARITPVIGAEASPDRLARLAKDGIVVPPGKRRRASLKAPPGKGSSGTMAALLDQRAEGR